MKIKLIPALFSILCLFYFNLISCEKKEESDPDPCELIQCQNDGLCNGSGCSCPDYFTGDRCQDYKIPAAIRVSRIQINNFPQTDGGQPWDAADLSGPELYIWITRDQGSFTIFKQVNYFKNAVNTNTYTINFSTPLILSASQIYEIYLMDQDQLSQDDVMTGVSGAFYKPGTPYDNPIVIDQPGMRVEFTVVYQF